MQEFGTTRARPHGNGRIGQTRFVGNIPISLQLYSVRHECAQDLLGVIAKVGAMGYEGVEFAGFHGHSAKAVRKALDDAGLKCSGTHTGIGEFADDKLSATVDYHLEIGAPYPIVPWIPEEMRNSADAAKKTGATFAEVVEKLKPHGLQTGFHAHEGDMKPLPTGETAWDLIAENTPKEFLMQYDTANGMSGGADPVNPILKHPGRSVSVHLKEWGGKHGAVIGEGDVPWAKVFEACESVGGTKWYVVEYEVEGVSALDAVEQCLKNLRAMGK